MNLNLCILLEAEKLTDYKQRKGISTEYKPYEKVLAALSHKARAS